jgi:hypothetical protein
MFQPVLRPSAGMSAQEPKHEDTISIVFCIVTFCLGSCIDMPEDGLSTGRNA